VDNLAPIVSPMVAMSRVMREKYGKDTKIVFIGPCVAKKAESSEIDEAITFTELRRYAGRQRYNCRKQVFRSRF
jgi:iron only hydrogenase large subunit-like protein